MNAAEAFLAMLTPEQQLAVHGALFPAPPTAPPVTEDPPPPARMTDAEFIADLANIAAGRRAEGMRQRGIIPGGSAALPPAEISRRDSSALLANLAEVASGQVKVVP
jgi:hypothetical protein